MRDHNVMLQYKRKMTCIRNQSGLFAPPLVANFIEAGLSSARYYEKKHCFILQELYLRQTFYELLERVCDTLMHHSIRRQCLAQLYKPQLALKRFYKTHHCIEKYFSLEREAYVLCQEFNPT